MAARCSKCGAEIADDWTVCRSCFEPVKPEGWLKRLMRCCGVRIGPGSLSINIDIKRTESIKIRDPVTGELREYRSLDDVPPEFREQITKLREQTESTQTVKRLETIVIRDSSGKLQTYRSVDELPPQLKEFYEKTRGKA